MLNQDIIYLGNNEDDFDKTSLFLIAITFGPSMFYNN